MALRLQSYSIVRNTMTCPPSSPSPLHDTVVKSSSETAGHQFSQDSQDILTASYYQSMSRSPVLQPLYPFRLSSRGASSSYLTEAWMEKDLLHEILASLGCAERPCWQPHNHGVYGHQYAIIDPAMRYVGFD